MLLCKLKLNKQLLLLLYYYYYNKWIDAFITGITDSGRSYETQVDATGKQLTRNCYHIRQRGPDIPHMHASFLQCNVVPSATSDGNAPSERENSVISGCQQLANGQKTVISANRKGSIKTNQYITGLSFRDSARQEGPAEQMSKDDKVWGQPCGQHCVYSTQKATRT